ncbi:MAG: glycosyltransferase family 2 protein [Blastocatellales bacterium]
MRIDVIIATYNRAALLEGAVRSVLSARRRPEFDFMITVVDNNSTDGTRDVVARLAEESNGCVRYLFEPRQGKSYAVNTGVAATEGDVIAFADDDQVMDGEWLCAAHQAFADGFDYVTGRVLGEWEVEPPVWPAWPTWFDERLRGPVSIFDGGDERYSHDGDETRQGFSGGNSAITRVAIEKIGGFHSALGKQSGSFAMNEDGEMLTRLLKAGFRGVYEPRMKVLHRVPRERLTKSYFRRWHRGYGRSMALIDRLHPKPVKYWLGVPRFLIRRAVESFPRMIAARLRGDLPGAFEQELNLWFMLGFIGGKLNSSTSDAAPNLNQGGGAREYDC